MTEPRFIGLSGYARAGKDSVADILVSERGYKRITFAGKLKQAVAALDPFLGRHAQAGLVHLSEALEYIDADKLKVQYPEYRRLLQAMGTEVGRNIFGENFWVDIAFKGLSDDEKYVITDARFPNEYDAVKEHLGVMWRVNRPGTGPVNSHPSETSLDNHEFDAWIQNKGTLGDLKAVVLTQLDNTWVNSA